MEAYGADDYLLARRKYRRTEVTKEEYDNADRVRKKRARNVWKQQLKQYM